MRGVNDMFGRLSYVDQGEKGNWKITECPNHFWILGIISDAQMSEQFLDTEQKFR